MPDATGVAEVMLGLPGFRVLDAQVIDDELVINVETIPELTGCPECGVVATAHDRMSVEYRDLPAFGRPVRLVWDKRRFRCEEPECSACTWTEVSDALSVRCLLYPPCGAHLLPAGRPERPARGAAGPRARRRLAHSHERRT